MVESSTSRFEMAGTRSAILDGPSTEFIEQHIDAIENAVESVPDFAFDLSKTLIESVCKTVLADIGQPANPNWDAPQLLRETTNRLNLLPRNHPHPANARDSVVKTLRGMFQTVQGLCELRNSYGMASHGRDAFSPRLGIRQATLAAHAADTIVSFLYRIHHDALTHTPGVRIYYEDHADFNEAFDLENEPFRLGNLELLPSHVLFHVDREAYRAALDEHLAEPDEPESADDQAASGENSQEAG